MIASDDRARDASSHAFYNQTSASLPKNCRDHVAYSTQCRELKNLNKEVEAEHLSKQTASPKEGESHYIHSPHYIKVKICKQTSLVKKQNKTKMFCVCVFEE